MRPTCHPLVTIKLIPVTGVREVPTVLQRRVGDLPLPRHKIDMTLVAHLKRRPRGELGLPRPAPAARYPPAPCTMCHDNTGRTLVECVLAHGGTILMRKKAWLRAAAGLTAAALVLTACSQKSNEGTSDNNNGGGKASTAGWPETPVPEIKEGKKGGTFKFGITEPTAIDPYNAQESEGLLVTKYLFTGLIQVDPDGGVHPGVAKKWESN